MRGLSRFEAAIDVRGRVVDVIGFNAQPDPDSAVFSTNGFQFVFQDGTMLVLQSDTPIRVYDKVKT